MENVSQLENDDAALVRAKDDFEEHGGFHFLKWLQSNDRISKTTKKRVVRCIKRFRQCGFCKVQNVRLLLCSRCKDMSYCSRKHQKKHWLTHKTDCTECARE